MRIPPCLAFVALMAAPVLLFADDWPQWLGPRRDSVWRESGVVSAIPESGLPIRWRAPVGMGYAGPAVSGGKVFLMDYVAESGSVANNPGSRDKLTGVERVLCLSSDNGEVLWKHEYSRPYELSYGGGPRCTPTVDGDRVYALGAEGNLWCLSTADGKVIWSKDFVADFGAETPYWGVAAHPLVDEDTLYCLVGGAGSVAVAMDKRTGQEKWRALTAESQGYCPPTMVEQDGVRQLLIWHAESLNALQPATGKVLWTVPLKPSYGMSISAPRQLGDHVFVSGYGEAAILLRLNGTASPTEVWRGTPRTAVYAANVTPFLERDMIYGCDINSGALMGVRLDDGTRQWQTFEPTIGGERRSRYGTAFLVKHEDRFFLFSESGDLILAKLSVEGYHELGRFHVLEPTNEIFGRKVVWSHPAFAERCLFARNDRELVCVDLAADR